MATSATKLTYDDLALFPADGKRHELIDGESVKVLRRQEAGHGEDAARFGRAQLLTLRDGDVLATPLLPGLTLALSDVFA